MITTYYAVRLLCCAKDQHAKSIKVARECIVDTQLSNGSWGHSVIEITTAVLSLKVMDSETVSMNRAKQWLLFQKREAGWKREMVLYHWFENDKD